MFSPNTCTGTCPIIRSPLYPLPPSTSHNSTSPSVYQCTAGESPFLALPSPSSASANILGDTCRTHFDLANSSLKSRTPLCRIRTSSSCSPSPSPPSSSSSSSPSHVQQALSATATATATQQQTRKTFYLQRTHSTATATQQQTAASPLNRCSRRGEGGGGEAADSGASPPCSRPSREALKVLILKSTFFSDFT